MDFHYWKSFRASPPIQLPLSTGIEIKVKYLENLPKAARRIGLDIVCVHFQDKSDCKQMKKMICCGSVLNFLSAGVLCPNFQWLENKSCLYIFIFKSSHTHTHTLIGTWWISSTTNTPVTNSEQRIRRWSKYLDWTKNSYNISWGGQGSISITGKSLNSLVELEGSENTCWQN